MLTHYLYVLRVIFDQGVLRDLILERLVLEAFQYLNHVSSLSEQMGMHVTGGPKGSDVMNIHITTLEPPSAGHG
jgi:hypothetical protein